MIEIPAGNSLPSSWNDNYSCRFNYPYYEGDMDLPVIYDFTMRLSDDNLSKDLINIRVNQRVFTGIFAGSEIDNEEYKRESITKSWRILLNWHT